MSKDNSRALKIGAGVGVLAGVVLVGLSFFGFFLPCCSCISGPVSWFIPAGTGLIAGAVAAFMADWPAVEPEQRTSHGVQVGLRAGAMGSLFAGLSYAVMSFVMPLLSIALQALINGGGDIETLMAVLIASAIGMAIGLVINVVIALVSVVVGLALGAAAGAGVAMTQSS